MEKVAITINGRVCDGYRDQSVLNLARENGIHIPALCYHPELVSSGGSCRVCLVEAHQGGRMRLVTSCNYPVRKGLEIKTDTELVKKIRRGVLELLLSRVPDSDVIRDMAAMDGITETRFFKDEGKDSRDKCIACALCTLLTACATPVQHVPVAVTCPPMPRPPAELMRPLPTLDLLPPDLLPPTR